MERHASASAELAVRDCENCIAQPRGCGSADRVCLSVSQHVLWYRCVEQVICQQQPTWKPPISHYSGQEQSSFHYPIPVPIRVGGTIHIQRLSRLSSGRDLRPPLPQGRLLQVNIRIDQTHWDYCGILSQAARCRIEKNFSQNRREADLRFSGRVSRDRLGRI